LHSSSRTWGRGDGEAATGLQPPPTDLTPIGELPYTFGPLLYWVLVGGGELIGLTMPPLKDVFLETWAMSSISEPVSPQILEVALVA
jgi:hypothetical protein